MVSLSTTTPRQSIRKHRRRRHTLLNIQNLLFVALALLALMYYKVSVYLLSSGSGSGGSGGNGKGSSDNIQPDQNRELLHPPNSLSRYSDWRQYAIDLAAQTPDKIIRTLKTLDPFGVRTFESKLQAVESQKEAFLSLQELKGLFPCPQHRITLPDQRNHAKAKAFRDNTTPLHFLFFQHLRKAGGTNFCTLAQHNLPKQAVPRYYCMPDYHWEVKGRACAGCFNRFSTDEITQHMQHDGHKILGNEWDPFHVEFLELPATFATSFRKPLDRALSQFRFECIEERGCKIKNVTKWWDKRARDLTNVYTWTFSQEGVRKLSIGTTAQDALNRQHVVGKALDVVAKFNLVMSMEFLAYAETHVKNVLGFQDTSTLTERVRPHIGQAKRDDGQEHNNMGAAGIAKASWTPENYLPPETYTKMSHDLALDEILTDAARRMFLERIVCHDVEQYD